MPSRRRFKTLKDIERHKKNGFGQGELATYKPWLLVRDVPSKGRSHMEWSDLCGREHHLLSDHEYRYFLIQLWSGQNKDIRECYPLPQASTLAIAAALGYRHSVYRGTSTPVVMTTDFLFTRAGDNGKPVFVARSIKPAEALNDPETGERTLEKEEIQRVCWTMFGVHWALVTDEQIDQTLATNLEWVFAATRVKEAQADKLGLEALAIKASDLVWLGRPLDTVLAELARRIGRSFEHTVNLFKLALWTRAAEVDLTRAVIHTAEPLWAEPRISAESAFRRAA